MVRKRTVGAPGGLSFEWSLGLYTCLLLSLLILTRPFFRVGVAIARELCAGGGCFFACFGFEEISIQSFDVKKKYETPDASFELCV